ncbi:MAG TPA: phosphatase PAP2 family protein [Gaiellaceae bacterium]|jgi:membrane-associated phospholipid phosphatase
MARALALTGGALAVFTVLVVTGAMTGIDDWAIDHVMPGLDPHSHGGIVHSTGLWRPFDLDAVWWVKVLDAYLYPASFLVSALVVAALCAVLARRGAVVPAVVWLGAWLGANAAELVGKLGLGRPEVHWSNGIRPVHVAAFDHSYPSGHSARAVVLAALVAYVFPRVRYAAAAWVVLVPAALVVAGDHTVSDVVGGTLLGALIVLLAHAMIGAWTRLPTSSSSSSAGSSATPRPSSPTSPAERSTSPTPS